MKSEENESQHDDDLLGIYKGYLSAFDKINAPFKKIPGLRNQIERKRRILEERFREKDKRLKKFKAFVSILKGEDLGEKVRCKCGNIVMAPSDAEAGVTYQCPYCDLYCVKCPHCGTWNAINENNPASFACSECTERLAGEEPKETVKQSSKTESSLLKKYGRNLTDLAKKGKIENIIGREKEITEITETLIRKNKNNPVLIGEAGVGKTAVVEGLALAIASGKIPKVLHNKKIIQIDMGSLVAGTKYRGEFEERLIKIIDEASSDSDIVLFIDEIHTIMGAGDSDGSLDASNMLKPALARGELKCIGATTNDEYSKYIEKDSALERRFQPVRIEELPPDATKNLLLKLKKDNEKHYDLKIDDKSIELAVDLAVKYIISRRLPDKAIDVLHQACAKAVIRKQSRVDEMFVKEVVSEWTGLPLLEVDSEERNRVLKIEQILKENIIGQDNAVKKIAEAVKRLKAGLKDPKRPAGVFLFLGPTGVGKTELAKVLAAFLFGSKDRIIRLDMSEFMEEHSVSKIIGAPPGYKGYDEGNDFIDNVRRHPYSVVLLDEIEKAHQRIFDLFLQVFDEGRLTDSRGRQADMTSCILIMTSNLKQDEVNSRFRPEFLNRIDEVIAFEPLEKESVFKIARNLINGIINERLKGKEIELEFNDDVLEMIYKDGFSAEMGARSVKRAIEKLIVTPLSEEILSGKIKEGQRISMKAVNDKMELVNLGARRELKSIKEKAKDGESIKPILKEEKSTEEVILAKTIRSGRCPNPDCKSLVSKTAKFCRKCGTKL